MPRLARVKEMGAGAYYHLYARTSGLKGELPLDDKYCRRTIVDYMKFFSKVYCCKVLGFCVMGNHYHMVVWMDEPEKLSGEDLRKRAELLYDSTILNGWLKKNWERFEERIFDVSELMRSLQSSLTRWFNRSFGHRGSMWTGRFKSTLLEDRKEAMDCLLYIDLNPVRAGIVQRPEEYNGSSVYYRSIYKDKWMMSLGELTGNNKRGSAMKDYKQRLYYRGSVPTKPGQIKISQRTVDEEEARGFENSGVYTKQLKHFVDGVVIGSEKYVKQHIERLREKGQYLRRKNPIKQMYGIHMSLREQRT